MAGTPAEFWGFWNELEGIGCLNIPTIFLYLALKHLTLRTKLWKSG